MSITTTLNKKNYLYPEQEKAAITNFSLIPTGKTKMIISDIKSEGNIFSIAINFLSKNNGSNEKIETISIIPENARKSFPNGTGYAYLNNKENREISLKYNNEDFFDHYYITLNPSTINNEHSVTFDIDFI